MIAENMYVALFCLIAAVLGVIGFLYNKRQLSQSKTSKKRQKGPGKSAAVSSGTDNAKEQQSRQQQSKGKSGGGKSKLATHVSDKPKFAPKATAFVHPWLASTLKGPASSVLDLDCAANDKLVTSCADESPRAQTESNRARPTGKPRRIKKEKPPPILPPPPVRTTTTTANTIVINNNNINTNVAPVKSAPAIRIDNGSIAAAPVPIKAPVKLEVQLVTPLPAAPTVPDSQDKMMMCTPRDQPAPAYQYVLPVRPVHPPARNCGKSGGTNKKVPSNTNRVESSLAVALPSNGPSPQNTLSVYHGGSSSSYDGVPDSVYYFLLRNYLMDISQQILHSFPIEVYGMPGLVYVPEKSGMKYGLYDMLPELHFDEDERARQCCRCNKNLDPTVVVTAPTVTPNAPIKKRRGRRSPPATTLVATCPAVTTTVIPAPPSDKDKCVYHWGRLYSINRDVERVLYTCCYQPENSTGCTVGCHVRRGRVDGYIHGFVKTRPAQHKPVDGNYGVCALDTEMCYTTDGLQVARVTLLRLGGEVLYETMVKTESPIVDYNTRFSGLTADHLAGATRTLLDVQRDLLTLINSETILIGHGLENDLRTLRLLHHTVVDTSQLFPHSYGLPYRRSLRSLSSLYLHHEIQTAESGHCSREDAKACIDLVLWKVNKDFCLDDISCGRL